MSVGYILDQTELSILAALRRAKRPLTGSEMSQYYFSRKITAARRDQALSRLVDRGLVVAADQAERTVRTVRVFSLPEPEEGGGS